MARQSHLAPTHTGRHDGGVANELKIRLENAAGEKLTPEGVELGDLLAVLEGLRAAILLNAGIDDLTNPPLGVSLVALEVNSVVPVLRPATGLEDSTDQVLDAIERRDPARLRRSAAAAAHRAFDHARSKRWVVHVGGRGREVVVDELHPFPAPEAEPPLPTVTGSTTLYGRCATAGGTRSPKVKLQLLEGGTVEAKATREQAKQLGERLYDVVGVRGIATWDTRTWTIERFEVQEVLDYEPVPVRQAFLELREAIGDVYDTDASIEALRALRDED
jgi:hypothetical protein